ncbi:MAG: ABC transporter permease [Cyclobacteriaceae bacterium]|nr:ABC transporter permease [Cyclobacteriaceae bacterium]MCH8516735.1 ABC transporter permease [Cyclobacteriaceae bacterium]
MIGRFIISKLRHALFVLIGVGMMVFFLFHALPGDPVAMMAGQRTDVSTRSEMSKELGLEATLLVQFGKYMNDLSPLGLHAASEKSKYEYFPLLKFNSEYVLALKWPYLRRSFQNNRKVSDIIKESLTATLWLVLAAMMFAALIGITLGIIAALYSGTLIDKALIAISTLGISIPSFVSAVLMAMIFGYYLSDITGLNHTGQLYTLDPIKGKQLTLKNIILPAITLGLRPLSIITQLTRSSMLEVLTTQYIRTARAKGLTNFQVLIKHALPNALNPVLTASSGWLAGLMTGAFFVEYIFDWKGFGFMTIRAVQNLDFPLVMGATLALAVIFIIINITVDILYGILDPRIRKSQ